MQCKVARGGSDEKGRTKRRVVERRMRNLRACFRKICIRPRKPIVGLWNKRRGSAKLNEKPWRESVVSENAAVPRTLGCIVKPRHVASCLRGKA